MKEEGAKRKQGVKRETSKALQKLFYQFTHLPLGGKKIPCPYWINKLRPKVIYGCFGGKGTPAQIIKATQKEAQKEGVDLKQLTSQEIRAFMKRKQIGIDCSGFVYQMLDALDQEKGGKGIKKKIYSVWGKGIRRTNAASLSSQANTFEVDLKQVKVGDVIRLRKGKHIAIVLELIKDARGRLKKLVYAHSSSDTEIDGVHQAIIEIKNIKQPLEKQKWLEKTKKGRGYRQEAFFPQAGDGLRRLKIWV